MLQNYDFRIDIKRKAFSEAFSAHNHAMFPPVNLCYVIIESCCVKSWIIIVRMIIRVL